MMKGNEERTQKYNKKWGVIILNWEDVLLPTHINTNTQTHENTHTRYSAECINVLISAEGSCVFVDRKASSLGEA